MIIFQAKYEVHFEKLDYAPLSPQSFGFGKGCKILDFAQILTSCMGKNIFVGEKFIFSFKRYIEKRFKLMKINCWFMWM